MNQTKEYLKIKVKLIKQVIAASPTNMIILNKHHKYKEKINKGRGE